MTMGKLKVYYGWAKIGTIRKKRAISVIYENEWHGCRCDRGQRILRAAQETVIERYQDEEEEKAAKDCTRIFTEYSLFFDENTDEELVKFREKLERKKIECAECEKRLEQLVEKRRNNQ